MYLLAAAPDLTAYTTAIGDIITGIATAVPTMAVSVGAVGAGVLVLVLGFRFLRRFVK